ncbi:CLEC10A [Branchiostoma lanceolatum]|uniref:CLEC10A protein n=1 Tax=Branchiostoma lanceolatum TaxID=7740 RepID=A0A8K0EFY8_BRALA|nr:CLEC10A [Branchiostoma lanceolatum]
MSALRLCVRKGALLVTTLCLLQTGWSAHWSDKDKTPVRKELCPEDGGWIQGGGSCYRFVQTPTQWIMAEYLCREYFHKEARPVTITSQDENEFVWKLVGDRDAWIGLQDISHPDRDVGVWQWSDGTNITRKMYKNWYPGAPNGGGESCAMFWEGGAGTWEDEECREEYPFICEMDIDECARGLHKCSPKAICQNTDNGYECECAIGYEGDGFTCEKLKPGQQSKQKKPKEKKPKKPKRSYKDLDKCVKGLNKCAPQAICENVGDSYRCTCAMGYVGDGYTCQRDTPELREQRRKQKAEEQAKAEQAKAEQAKAEQPKEEQPKEEQPKEEQPKEEQPMKKQPKEEQPMEKQPMEEQPKEEMASEKNAEEVNKDEL